MSSSDSVYEAELVDLVPRPPQRGSNWWRWGTVGLIVAMVLGPLAVRQVPREIANWHAAAALELRLDGKSDEAFERLQRAVERDPRNPLFYLQRARWYREDKRYEAALEDCNRAHELAEGSPLVLIERSEVYQHLKRFPEAVADWKEIAELNERRKFITDVTVWNGLAYTRAVAGLELEAGLEDAERAAKREPEDPMILDTRGFLLYRLGKFDDALKDLDVAVKGFEAQLAASVKNADPSSAAVLDPRQAKRDRKHAETVLAVILYHRSLILDKLDQPEAAAADRDRVRQLGATPGEDLF